MTDSLPPVVRPDLERFGDPPAWITSRGQDCRAHDRREDRLVWGPGHPILQPHDLLVTNGILRFWPGPAQYPPFLHVEAFRSAQWRHVGDVTFEQDPFDRLETVRIVRLTPDDVTVALESRPRGDILVTLRRGERMLRVRHGPTLTPPVLGGHYARWRGAPPALALTGVANGAGLFGDGLTVPSLAEARWPWPLPAGKTAWSWTGVWLPAAASGAQPDSGILSIFDTVQQVASVRWDDATNAILLKVGSGQVSSGPLVFAANTPIRIAAAFDTTDGMALTVRAGGGVVATVTAPAATDPGTGDDGYLFFALGSVYDGASAGTGTSGSGPAGGTVANLNGVLDNVQIYDTRLTDSQRVALMSAATPLDGLPDPDARLVLFLPFDARILPAGSAYADGRRYETTVQDGIIRNPDGTGMTKAVAVLTDSAVATGGLSLGDGGKALEAAVYLAIETFGEDLDEQHDQFAAVSEQEARIR